MGVGAVAGGLGGGIGAGVGGLSGAIWGGLAAGGVNGGGMAAINGGGALEIFSGTIGGALMGGSMAFLGGAAMMGISNAIGNIQLSNNWMVKIPAGGYNGQGITYPLVKDLVNHVTNGVFSNGGGGGLVGSLSGVGAGNLFQFASGSVTPPKVNLQSNTINGFVDWFSYLHQNRSSHYKQGIHYHVDDIVDHRTILGSHLNKGMYGESLTGVENSVQWSIADPHYRKRSHWNDNYVDSPIADQPDRNVDYFRIRLMLNRRTKISITTNSYDLYIKMHNRIYDRRVY